MIGESAAIGAVPALYGKAAAQESAAYVADILSVKRVSFASDCTSSVPSWARAISAAM